MCYNDNIGRTNGPRQRRLQHDSKQRRDFPKVAGIVLKGKLVVRNDPVRTVSPAREEVFRRDLAFANGGGRPKTEGIT